jgi:hypothetical protein
VWSRTPGFGETEASGSADSDVDDEAGRLADQHVLASERHRHLLANPVLGQAIRLTARGPAGSRCPVPGLRAGDAHQTTELAQST